MNDSEESRKRPAAKLDRSRDPNPAPSPSSRKRIVDALLDAAEELFAERGPDACPVREVARKAGLQHSLIFRHIGKKRDLVRAVYERAFRRQLQNLHRDTPPLEILQEIAKDSTARRLFLRRALDHISGETVIHGVRFDTLVSRIAEAQRRGSIVRSIPPEIVYALGLSFGIGWLLFGDLLMLALKVHPTRADEFRAQVPEAAAGLLQGRVGTNSADAPG